MEKRIKMDLKPFSSDYQSRLPTDKIICNGSIWLFLVIMHKGTKYSVHVWSGVMEEPEVVKRPHDVLIFLGILRTRFSINTNRNNSAIKSSSFWKTLPY